MAEKSGRVEEMTAVEERQTERRLFDGDGRQQGAEEEEEEGENAA